MLEYMQIFQRFHATGRCRVSRRVSLASSCSAVDKTTVCSVAPRRVSRCRPLIWSRGAKDGNVCFLVSFSVSRSGQSLVLTCTLIRSPEVTRIYGMSHHPLVERIFVPKINVSSCEQVSNYTCYVSRYITIPKVYVCRYISITVM